MFKNPNWHKADKLANVESKAEELNLGKPPGTNPVKKQGGGLELRTTTLQAQPHDP